MKLLMRAIISRFKDLDKWSYYMNIAFGLSLLLITLQFQFGKTTIITPHAIINLDKGYIAEPLWFIRLIEGILSILLILLGVERIKNAKRNDRRTKERNSGNG